MASGQHIKDLKTVESHDIKTYLGSLKRRGLKKATKRRKYIVVRAIFSWFASAGEITINPTLHIKVPSVPDSDASHLNKAQYRKLLSVVQNMRDRAIIQTFLQTGMRLSELQRLELSDLELPEKINLSQPHFSMGKVRILAKGGDRLRIRKGLSPCVG